MTASVIDTVAKYFYFSTLDENLSFTASLKTLSDLKNHSRLDEKYRAEWVRALLHWRDRLNKIKPRGGATAAMIHLPRGFDMTAWRSFLNTAEREEIDAVLLHKILRFSEGEIAVGLNVTTGTVRYRLGRGLRHLGGFQDA
ncbi:MAG TPA: sigma-70 region 4 domain-containing protein [Bdellovibrionales bacterium]|nr:sigma-70 region 4 domain-containing protein [Bdellovibrionales bacterium]